MEKTNAELEIQRQNDQRNQVNDGSKSPPTAPLVESEEEDQEIIESLTQAHSQDSDRHVDIDGSANSTQATAEIKNKDNKDLPSSSSKLKNERTKKQVNETESIIDEAMADLEVSQLTSISESKDTFSALPGLQDPVYHRAPARADKRMFPVMPALGPLPGSSDPNLPRRVPARHPLADFPAHSSTNHSTNVGLGVITFDTGNDFGASNLYPGSRFNRAEYTPRNGGGSLSGSRRTVRLLGESDDDPTPISTSPTLDSESPPPLLWKLNDYESPTKNGNGGNGEDINEILESFHVVNPTDDNASSIASKDDDKNDDKNDDKK